MMTDSQKILPEMKGCYGTLPSMIKKFDRYARRDCFAGETRKELEAWQKETRELLGRLLGLDKMETCPLQSLTEDVTVLPDGIRREHVRIQAEPDVWVTLYLLIPEGADESAPVILCPHGHGGNGKYAVAGLREYKAIAESIRHYEYDYGLQAARRGYVAVCPDSRGFGERREDPADAKDPETAMKNDCYRLAHMGEPLGIPAAGMFTWDLMRILDYLEERKQWNTNNAGCLGFSGGGMQTLFLSALDERIRFCVISGYFYGYKDALLTLNNNCSCNYVPHLWEHLDMGDIGCLIAPRPMWIQSCRDDRLNGPRGIVNAQEQVEIVRRAYGLMEAQERVIHEICEGPHRWHGENLEILERLVQYGK